MMDYYFDDEGLGTFQLFDLLRRQLTGDVGEELNRSLSGFQREGDRLVFRLDMPGVGPDDVEVTVHGNTITLRAERPDDAPDGYRLLRKERTTGWRISRTMTVPMGAKTDNIDCELKDGVLTIRFEVSPDAGPRRIELKTDQQRQQLKGQQKPQQQKEVS